MMISRFGCVRLANRHKLLPGRRLHRGIVSSFRRHDPESHTADLSIIYRPRIDHNAQQPLRRLFSSSPQARGATAAILRNMVKPFLLKCHPDVQRSETAKEINLSAIQHLNAYLDTVQGILATHKRKGPEPSSRIFEVDFILTLAQEQSRRRRRRKPKKKEPQQEETATSRRKVELALPPLDLCRRIQSLAAHSSESLQLREKVQHHSAMQLVRLLKMASLEVPKDLDALDDGDGDHYYDKKYEQQEDFLWEDALDLNRRPHSKSRFDFQMSPEQQAYNRNRERFVKSINWKKYDQVYKQAVQDMKADFATEGLIKDHAGRRRTMIASVLAKVRLQEETDVVEQLVAIRRLSLLLDEFFEKLQMEEFGRLWESCNLVLTPARSYNVSSSALHKRRMQGDDAGFSFTLHPDFSVTITIPIDFRDEELIQELERNIWDIYELLEADDGFQSIFSAYSL